MTRHLSINPEPIKLVDASVRDVWFRQPPRRCYHEDGRGQCRAAATFLHAVPAPVYAEWYCERHAPKNATNLSTKGRS